MAEVNDSIEQAELEIVDVFSFLESWDDKYEYIIDLGKKLPVLADEHKQEVNVVKGCQSTLWLVAHEKDGKIYFEADSDAIIVKGLVSMMIKVLSGRKAEDIVSAKLEFIDKIGMTSHLAQTRSNGLLSMIKQMKQYALAYQLKSEKKQTDGYK